jgi:hypothetical protein
VYCVIDDDQVQEQVAALPAEALSAYAEARTLLEVALWSGSPYPQGEAGRADADAHFRQLWSRGVPNLGAA